ncbi:MBL fold metallo-hydrolase [Sphingobium sp. Sx8-8]|uniref:MBL fold metallo-hydrolase n=1 Tax=Sphingobium sp. Sx8-8 TaxID=2933617 RepID=UPI001F563128|nr:MBL fold metallo-hydrolase [Sphingobium sp. Sx8-8]
MLSWSVGDVTISAVVEGEHALSCDLLFPKATVEELAAIEWARPDYVTPDLHVRLTIQVLLVKTPQHRIVVDTCVGNDKHRVGGMGHMLSTDLLERMTAQGFGRDDVDIVLCTHLHVDHVGWNTMLEGGRWVPTFPRARYLIGRGELDYWRGQDEGDNQQILADSIQPMFDAGLVDLVEPDHRICAEVRLIPTPGHTPGHVSVRIESVGQAALITGDTLHNPVQLARPDWGAFVDCDPGGAEVTRRRLAEELADSATLVIGTHFSAPTAGHVVRDGEAFRLERRS